MSSNSWLCFIPEIIVGGRKKNKNKTQNAEITILGYAILDADKHESNVHTSHPRLLCTPHIVQFPFQLGNSWE